MTTVPSKPSDDMLDRFEVTADQDADLVDIDAAVARFLLAFTKRNGPPCTDGPLHVFATPISQGATDALYPTEAES